MMIPLITIMNYLPEIDITSDSTGRVTPTPHNNVEKNMRVIHKGIIDGGKMLQRAQTGKLARSFSKLSSFWSTWDQGSGGRFNFRFNRSSFAI